MAFTFPRIYPILDSSFIPVDGRKQFLLRLGSSLAEAAVTLLEYRNKTGGDVELLADAAILRAVMPLGEVKLILDDRADLVDLTAFDGVHVDAGDVSPVEARRLLGAEGMVGTFGGSRELVAGILEAPADYLAVGPVYATRTKQTATAPIGPEGVWRLREAAGPGPVLVAVGGVTFETAGLVLEAGASSVGVAAGIFGKADPAGEFRRWMAAVG